MKLLSVNVSLPRDVVHKGKSVSTGIFKTPVQGRVRVRSLNIEGDGQADLIGHGGEFRAVYVYSFDHYAHWQNVLGRADFEPGQFGENLTVEGMLEQDVHVGDRFRIGAALFEVTQPRVPCYKLAMKMGVEGFYAQILESGRLGFYLRVVEEGEIGAGDIIERVHEDPARVTVFELNRLMYFDKEDLETQEKALHVEALSPGWKTTFEKRLEKARSAGNAESAFRTFRVEHKVEESETITSFHLAPEDGKPLDSFLPGQFLPLKLDIPGSHESVSRTYSLSDRPGIDHYRLTIKRELAPPDQPEAYPGVASNYFHDRVEVGTKILAKTPRGKFSLDPDSDTSVVLLSAGVGMTPMISMWNTIAEVSPQRRTWFIHGARNGREHALGDTVRRVAEANPHMHAHVRYSKPTSRDVAGRDHDEEGHVDIDLVKRLVPDRDHDFYLCGPSPFMKAMYSGLLDWGVPEARIHYEFFGPASVLGERAHSTEKDTAEATTGGGEFLVEFSGSRVTTRWDSSFESILDLAEENGLSPDHSCRSGICQTCICTLESGDVEYVQEPLEIPEPGEVLICCAKPTSNVVIGI